MNAREQLAAVADWLGWQDESLSFGLRSSLDALRLYDYSQSNPHLPEMADAWSRKSRIAALSYDPLDEPEASRGGDVAETGAAAAAAALHQSRRLLDCVAFVANEGDTEPVLRQIDAVFQR